MKRIITWAVVAVTLSGVAALFVLGRDTFTYGKSLFNSLRRSAREKVPLDLEIQRARDLNAEIQTDLEKLLETFTREQIDAERLEKAIGQSASASAAARRELVRLKGQLEAASGPGAPPLAESARKFLEAQLAVALRQDQTSHEVLAHRRAALEAKRKGLETKRARLLALRAESASLGAEIERLTAAIECLRSADPANADDSPALAQARQATEAISQRVQLLTRMADNREQLLGPPPAADGQNPASKDQPILTTVSEYLEAQDQSPAAGDGPK